MPRPLVVCSPNDLARSIMNTADYSLATLVDLHGCDNSTLAIYEIHLPEFAA